MKLCGKIFWYGLFPVMVFLGMTVCQKRLQGRVVQQLPHFCIRPVRWRITLE